MCSQLAPHIRPAAWDTKMEIRKVLEECFRSKLFKMIYIRIFCISKLFRCGEREHCFALNHVELLSIVFFSRIIHRERECEWLIQSIKTERGRSISNEAEQRFNVRRPTSDPSKLFSTAEFRFKKNLNCLKTHNAWIVLQKIVYI